MNLPAVCQSCGERGVMRPHAEMLASGTGKEPWCKCGPKKLGGPYVNPPGHVTVFIFESKDAAAFREQCRLAGNAERQARDAITEARYTASGRRRPDSSPRVRSALKAHRAAIRAHEKLQAVCSHPSRSIFNRIFCDVCHAQVECDVEHYRHIVREAGVHFANRVAV